MARWLIPLVMVFAIGCRGEGGASDDADIPPPQVDGVGIFQTTFGFREGPSNSYVGGGMLFSDGARAIGGFCNATKGFYFDYRYTRDGDTTSGTGEVRGCPTGTYWSGAATGAVVDNADNDFGPFDVTGGSGSGRGYASSTSYLQGLTERYLQLEDLYGTYTSTGYQTGGLTFNGYIDVNASIDANGFTLVGTCGPGTITIPSVGKNLATVTLPACRNGKTVSGFIALDGDTLHVAMTVEGEYGSFAGAATRQP